MPAGDGPELFSLEQTASGKNYLRGVAGGGIQVWTWLMSEKVHNVELVCGDWMGGALISANRADSFTLHTVGKDGKLRWQQELAGVRKGHAYDLQQVAGARKFDLTTAGVSRKTDKCAKRGYESSVRFRKEFRRDTDVGNRDVYIIPDGLGGVPLPVRWSHDAVAQDVHNAPDEPGFATRGGHLIAFNVRGWKELWSWNSNTPGG